MKNSFMVTGASATGKSTLINIAKNNNYIYLPTHMTRVIRKNEVDGVDAVFLSNKQFEENFDNNLYLEESLDFALLHSLNIYYGTPRNWIDYLKKDGYCASPVSLKIAKEIFNRNMVLWIHLICNLEDRMERLVERGISEEEVKSRLTAGDSIMYNPSDAYVIDTSKENAEEIFEKVRSLKIR